MNLVVFQSENHDLMWWSLCSYLTSTTWFVLSNQFINKWTQNNAAQKLQCVNKTCDSLAVSEWLSWPCVTCRWCHQSVLKKSRRQVWYLEHLYLDESSQALVTHFYSGDKSDPCDMRSAVVQTSTTRTHTVTLSFTACSGFKYSDQTQVSTGDSSDGMSFNDTHYINASSHNICTVTHVRTHSRSGTEEQNHRRRHVHKNTLINCGRRRRLAREAQNKYGWWLKSSVNTLHSNSRSSSFSSVSMFAGSAMGPSLARRASISRSVLSLSCFFFSWIFFSLEQDMNHK